MVLFAMPRPVRVGQRYSAVNVSSHGVVFPGWPAYGKPLNSMFWFTLSIVMSKLGVLVTLKMSNVYRADTRSLIFVVFPIEMSPRLCQGCRKMLRWPFEME